MKTAFRLIGFATLTAAGIAALRSGTCALFGAIALGILAHAALRTSARMMFYLSVPVMMFALALLALQWLDGSVDPRLPLRLIAVFSLSTSAARLVPPPGMASLRPRSRMRLPFLFLLFVRHFSVVLLEEVRRTFQARSLCISSEFSRGGLRSLTWATVAVFRRSLDRAERFYAAQLIGGFPQ